MAYYYSASERAFFSTDLMTTGAMPSDKVLVDDSTYASLQAAQVAGKIIRTGAAGAPEAVSQSLKTLAGLELGVDLDVEDLTAATLKVEGASNLAGGAATTTLKATGAATLSGGTTTTTLKATGTSTLSDVNAANISTSGTLTSKGAATLSGGTTTTTLKATGTSTLAAVNATTVTASGAIKGASLTSTGALVGGSLQITGETATVGGKNLVRSVNGVAASAAGDVKVPSYEVDGVQALGSNVDYDDVTLPGFYHVNASGALNGPGYPSKLIVLSGKTGASILTQVAFPIFSESGAASVMPKYRNRSDEGVWTKWFTLAHSDSESDFLARNVAAAGSMTVGNKHVVRSINGFSANSSGAVKIPNFEQDGVTALGVADYNTITEPGFYSCTGTGSTNGPGNARKILVLGNSGATTYLTQIAFPIGKGDAIALRYRNANGDWSEWLKVGTEGAGFVDPSPSSNDNSIATTSWVRANTVPAGTILPFAGTTVPTGFLLCNGALVSRTTYANLYAAIGTKWGEGDGKTTFKLPDLRKRHLEGANTASEVGGYIEAGLPNIIGTFFARNDDHAPTGAFSRTDGWTGGFQAGGYGRHDKYTFDASTANAAYGASSTVTPPSAKALYIIKS